MLLRAVCLRNFLAHEYFRQRAAAFLTEDGKNQMIEELKKATAFFEDVDSRLEPPTMQIIEAIGVDKHMPEALECAPACRLRRSASRSLTGIEGRLPP